MKIFSGSFCRPVPALSIDVRQKKVASVALASLLFFSVQMTLSTALVLTASASVTLLTYWGDTYLPKEVQPDWFGFDCNWRKVALFVSFAFFRPWILQLFCCGFGIRPWPVSLEFIGATSCLSPQIGLIATLIAPIAEEILFRGFLVERLCDCLHLFNRHTFIKMGLKTQNRVSEVVHAAIFALCHLKDLPRNLEKSIVFCSHFYTAIWKSRIREENRSLAPSALIQAAGNLGCIVFKL